MLKDYGKLIRLTEKNRQYGTAFEYARQPSPHVMPATNFVSQRLYPHYKYLQRMITKRIKVNG